MRSRLFVAITLMSTVASTSVLAQAQGQALPFEFSSVIFGNFQMRVDSQAKVTTGGEPTNRFDIGRAYLTFRFPVGEKASARITTDIFQQTNTAAAAFYPGWAIRLKYGYLQYDATKNLFGVNGLAAAGRIGMLQTVVVEHIESFWPRWLGNSPPELHGFFSSADVGASGVFTLPNRWGEVYTTVTNGLGYAAPEIDRFKDVAARVTLTPFARNDSSILRTFAITPWYYKGWLASGYTQATPPVSDGLQKDRRGVFIGLRDRKLTLGAELDQRIEEQETTAPPVARGALNERTSQLLAAFALVRPAEWFGSKRSRFGVVGRYDRFQIDTDADPYSEFIVAGATWDLNSRITLALDYQASTPRDNPTGIPVKAWFFHYVATF